MGLWRPVDAGKGQGMSYDIMQGAAHNCLLSTSYWLPKRLLQKRCISSQMRGHCHALLSAPKIGLQLFSSLLLSLRFNDNFITVTSTYVFHLI